MSLSFVFLYTLSCSSFFILVGVRPSPPPLPQGLLEIIVGCQSLLELNGICRRPPPQEFVEIRHWGSLEVIGHCRRLLAIVRYR
jgi:hypothetical protein